jgi:hypothetical protein
MKRHCAAAALALLLVCSSPALAWDPTREDPRPEPPQLEREPDPAPFVAPPPGIYYVTDTYVADVVTTSGPLTTYSTTTVHESTGSYARVLETVGTGTSSGFDGSAFNGRRTLGDGRPVAGTYYENFVLTDGAFIPVNVVFFQDDAEIARLLTVNTRAPAAAAPPSPPVTLPTPRPLAPPCCAAQQTVTIPAPTPAPPKTIRPGISLLPASGPLSRLEVLRGRAISLWPRAFADDREIPVRWWTLVRGDAGEPLATSGPGAVSFRSSWTRLAPPGAAFELVFRIEVDAPETGRRAVDAAIAVVVRSPALED